VVVLFHTSHIGSDDIDKMFTKSMAFIYHG
jgi:hypothetical protein